jgi:hypothetical protein
METGPVTQAYLENLVKPVPQDAKEASSMGTTSPAEILASCEAPTYPRLPERPLPLCDPPAARAIDQTRAAEVSSEFRKTTEKFCGTQKRSATNRGPEYHNA